MAGMPDWDWVSEKSVSALLIQEHEQTGMKKGPTTTKPKLKPDLE
jgi:hypothetical protein